MAVKPRSRSPLGDSNDSSSSAELRLYQNCLEVNARYLKQTLSVEKILPYIESKLPAFEIEQIKHEKRKQASAKVLVHSITRNMTGAFKAFLHALEIEQPDVHAVLESSCQLQDCDEEMDVEEEITTQTTQTTEITKTSRVVKRKNVQTAFIDNEGIETEKKHREEECADSNQSDSDLDNTMFLLAFKYMGKNQILEKKANTEGKDVIQSLKAFEDNKLKVIDLGECRLHDRDIPPISELLKRQNTVEAISLDKNFLAQPSLKTFFLYVRNLDNLIFLSLAETHFLDACMDTFILCLENKKQLTCLCLDGCKITDGRWQTLVAALSTLPELHTLSLNDTNAFDINLRKLAYALAKIKEIRSISLNRNSISDIGLQELIPCFRGASRLNQISLQDNHISDDGAVSLSKMIPYSEIRKLNLCGNQIGTKGAKDLLKAWKTRPSPTAVLDLRDNQINGDRLESKPNKNITLYENTSGIDRARIIRKRMERGEKFRKLNLNGIALTDIAIQTLEKPICNAGCLEVFEIKDNELSNGCLHSLVNIYHNCPDLKSIETEGNKELTCVLQQDSDSARGSLKELPFEELFKASSKGVVNFKHHKFKDTEIEAMCNFLTVNPPKIVSLRNCKLGDKRLSLIFPCFHKVRTSVQCLDLSGNMLTDTAADKFAAAYKTKKSEIGRKIRALFSQENPESETALRRLHLENNAIANQGITRLAEALTSNHLLTILHLKNNSIGSLGCKQLCKMLQKHHSLRHLSLRNNKLGDDGAERIAAGLVNNSLLLELDLGGNSITTEGLKYIGDALKGATVLRYLDLSNNDIQVKNNTDSGFTNFWTGIAKNQSLKILHFAENTISDLGTAKLTGVFSRWNRALTHLNLSSISIGYQGLQEISKLLKYSRCFVHLDISRNENLGHFDPRMSLLCSGLLANQSLTFLGLRNTGLKNDATADISNAIGQHQTLEKVDVTNNNINETELFSLVRRCNVRVRLIFDNNEGNEFLDRVLYTPFPDSVNL